MLYWRQAVRPGLDPLKTGLRVTLDARPLGGGYVAPFSDQSGRCADDGPDHVFSSCFMVPLNAPLGRAWRRLELDRRSSRAPA
jgi:hypothetical protein